MSPIEFGMESSDHLFITINGRPHPNDDWLNATIDIVSGSFSGMISASLLTCDFPQFRRELESLYNSLDGVAAFMTVERQLAIECTGDGRGGIEITGTVEDRAGGGNALSFHFDSDQTFLPKLIAQILAIEKSFPNRLHSNYPQ